MLTKKVKSIINKLFSLHLKIMSSILSAIVTVTRMSMQFSLKRLYSTEICVILSFIVKKIA